MPIICTKNRKDCYQPFTTRVLVKKQAEKDISNQTLRTFSIQNSNTSENSKVLAGTILPNSSIKKKLANNSRSFKSSFAESNHSIQEKKPVHIDHKNEKRNENKVFRKEHNKDLKAANSIVAGSAKLKELQELCIQLNKNPIVSKSPFEPRRPTLESIKSAIEKAKELNRDKNEGTDDRNSLNYMSDASTSTKRIVRKKKVIKNPPQNQLSGGNRKTNLKKNEKKTMVDVQVSAHIMDD